jgi:phosphatidate cytidylyltransferase
MTYSKIKKGNVKRLCPRLSPKKTVAGAIGGTIGGALGGLIVYFVFRSLADTVYFFSPLVLFIIVGVVASILTIVGDLTESYLKRKVGIKDMGKIMPGHGGIMDRIDGISVASVFIFFMFLFV